MIGRPEESRRARRATALVGLAALGLALAACSSTAGGRERMPVRTSSVSAEDALAQYRAERENDSETGSHINAEEAEAARRHTAAILGEKAISEFGLFIYINKNASGPMAQRAYLFAKDSSGELQHEDTWLVTTAREQHEVSPKGEKKFTTTPTGIYQFDPNMFVRLHKSNAWEADMPWAMFIKSRSGGPTQGYALHAALDKYVHNLGQRASAGCIRLLPENAEKLFKLLKRDYAGEVPRTSSTASLDLTVSSSRIRGIQALVIIDDTAGAKVLARYGRGSVASSGGAAGL